MRQQYHFRDSNDGLLAWDVFRLLKLSQHLTVQNIPLSDIKELDEPFWSELGGAVPTCRNVLEHSVLIEKADLSYPIILCHDGRVMDGMNRVCKAVKNADTYIKAVKFDEYISPDYVGVDADDLPY